MNPVLIQTTPPSSVDQVKRLFSQQDWTKTRADEQISTMLKGSDVFACAYDNEGVLIGFARAISDGVFRALIEDVIVDKHFQGNGIGQQLVASLAAQLEDVEEVFLNTGTHLDKFYSKFGFTHFKAHAMHLRYPPKE
jgi:predicted N-acetyltransferase YhbS